MKYRIVLATTVEGRLLKYSCLRGGAGVVDAEVVVKEAGDGTSRLQPVLGFAESW